MFYRRNAKPEPAGQRPRPTIRDSMSECGYCHMCAEKCWKDELHSVGYVDFCRDCESTPLKCGWCSSDVAVGSAYAVDHDHSFSSRPFGPNTLTPFCSERCAADQKNIDKRVYQQRHDLDAIGKHKDDVLRTGAIARKAGKFTASMHDCLGCGDTAEKAAAACVLAFRREDGFCDYEENEQKHWPSGGPQRPEKVSS